MTYTVSVLMVSSGIVASFSLVDTEDSHLESRHHLNVRCFILHISLYPVFHLYHPF
jgi:hypothetical protein